MKKTELITAGIAALAIIMQLFLLPGSGALTVISLSLLACIYFYCGFALFNGIRFRKAFKRENYAGISAMRIQGAVATGFVFSMIIIGMMFRLQSWPGAASNLVVGLIALLILVVVALLRYRNNRSEFYVRIFKRAAVFGVLGITCLLMSHGEWIRLKYRNHPAFAEAMIRATADPGNQQLWDKVDEEREKMSTEND
jgi:hypothetical protein